MGDHEIKVGVNAILYERQKGYEGEVKLSYQYKRGGISKKEVYIPVTANGKGPEFSLDKILDQFGGIDRIARLGAAERMLIDISLEYLKSNWDKLVDRLDGKNVTSRISNWSDRINTNYVDGDMVAGYLKDRLVIPVEKLPIKKKSVAKLGIRAERMSRKIRNMTKKNV